MGLDIYMNQIADIDDVKRREGEYERRSEENWKFNGLDYNSLTNEQKEEARKKNDAVKLELNLDDYGSARERVEVRIDHPEYPDHINKIGYFRSSYNESGFNQQMRMQGLPGLYEIFGRDRDEEDEFCPDWESCLERANEAIAGIKSYMARTDQRIVYASNVMVHGTPDMPKSAEQAIKMYRKQEKQKRGDGVNFDCYSNRDGLFIMGDTPLKLRAVIPGFNSIGGPTCWLIVENGEFNFYLQSAIIIRDTCQYALDHGPERHYLSWSG